MFKFDEKLRVPVDPKNGWSFVRTGGAYGDRFSKFLAPDENGKSVAISSAYWWEERTYPISEEQRKFLPREVDVVTVISVTLVQGDKGLLLPGLNAEETAACLRSALACKFEAKPEYVGAYKGYRVAGKKALFVEIEDRLYAQMEKAFQEERC